MQVNFFVLYNIMNDEIIWNIINSHFKDNYQNLVMHHIDSFNDFYDAANQVTVTISSGATTQNVSSLFGSNFE